jgi:hypothetical protein
MSEVASPINRFNLRSANEQLTEFAYNPGLERLASLYGVEELPRAVDERLLTLQGVAAAYWDFRGGKERQAVNWDIEHLGQPGSKEWSAVFEAADELGMVRSGELIRRQPDYLVVLGGANKAPLDRLRFGLASVVQAGRLAYLGSSRPLSDTERKNVQGYAPYANTEFDLGSAAFESLLGAQVVDEVNENRDGDTWRMRLYEYKIDDNTKQGFVLSTPTTVEGHRATTYDNYRFFADRAELSTSQPTTVASVTTSFYVPAQHLAGVQELMLPYGTKLETFGHSAEYSGVNRRPSQLLQETKAAVDAAVRLNVAIR